MDWSAPRPAVPQSQSAPCDVNYLCVPQKAVSNSQAGTGTVGQGGGGQHCHMSCNLSLLFTKLFDLILVEYVEYL